MPRGTRLPAALALALCVGAACAASPAGVPAWATAVLADGTSFTVEVAADEAKRARGYMGREVGAREAILFVFESPGRHSFWMKDCVVPLDIVWLDDRFRVVEVAASQAPCPSEGPCPSILPMRPGRYVLEFAAGTAGRHGLRPGARVDVLRPDGRPW